MRVIAIIQARMSSSRFPGKSLHPIKGKPMIGHLIDSLEKCRSLDDIVLATSTDPSDTPIAAYCAERGTHCVRGDLADVAQRFMLALEEHPCDAFTRICGDSPLLDYRQVDRGVALLRSTRARMVSSKGKGGLPPGQSVEVLDTAFFRAHYPAFDLSEDKEHVTHYFYRNDFSQAMERLVAEADYSDLDFAVDTPEDLRKCELIFDRMSAPSWAYDLDGLARLSREVEQTATKPLSSR
jgi:Spore coat polysaccharide biosynthesis protein F, CMP-KDO synthetase homolog